MTFFIMLRVTDLWVMCGFEMNPRQSEYDASPTYMFGGIWYHIMYTFIYIQLVTIWRKLFQHHIVTPPKLCLLGCYGRMWMGAAHLPWASLAACNEHLVPHHGPKQMDAYTSCKDGWRVEVRLYFLTFGSSWVTSSNMSNFSERD